MLDAMWGFLFAMAITLAVANSASAQDFPAPTNRNHSIDLHTGSAIGSAKIIGMGGAATAIAQGSSGMLSNVAAAGVRPATSNDTWDWDWHIDSLTSDFGNDFDNNGIETEERSFTPSFTGGLVVYYKHWGLGITYLSQRAKNTVSESGTSSEILSTSTQGNFALSRSFWRGQIAVAIGVRSIDLDVQRIENPNDSSSNAETLLSLQGGQYNLAAVWKPERHNIRLGLQLSPPVLSDKIAEGCDPLDCFGYILPNKAKAPWALATGIAYRHKGSRWNQKVKGHWRDERSLILAADIVVTGTTQNGVGLQAFTLHQLQPSGRSVSFSLRGGAQYEWLPGRLRVRAGSYWEGSRFLDPNNTPIPGRIHLTTGFDLRIWSFGFWNNPYRVKLSFAADFARQFGNSGLSLGLWH